MSATVNGEFHLGETWAFVGTVRNDLGVPEDLTGGTVRLRVATSSKLLFDLTTPTHGTITDAEAGDYKFEIGPAAQEAAGATAGMVTFEVRAQLANGRVTTQNTGTVHVHPSLFKLFP